MGFFCMDVQKFKRLKLIYLRFQQICCWSSFGHDCYKIVASLLNLIKQSVQSCIKCLLCSGCMQKVRFFLEIVVDNCWKTVAESNLICKCYSIYRNSFYIFRRYRLSLTIRLPDLNCSSENLVAKPRQYCS